MLDILFTTLAPISNQISLQIPLISMYLLSDWKPVWILINWLTVFKAGYIQGQHGTQNMSLFDLSLYVLVNNHQLCWDGSSWVEPVLSRD